MRGLGVQLCRGGGGRVEGGKGEGGRGKGEGGGGWAVCVVFACTAYAP